MPAVPPSLLVVAAAVVFAGGLVKGTAGFGYAIASTALLATLLSPSTAIVLMILPTLVANLSLLRELSPAELGRCLARFWPYVAAAMVGTAAGMALIEAIPTAALTVGLGLFTLLYVGLKQPWRPLPGERTVAAYCFSAGTPAKVGLGLVSGVVFGLSNVAVQVVAYLDSLELDRSTFVGVLAMILVGVSGLRVGLAWTLGLYDAGGLLVASAAVSVPGVVGVEAGRRLRTGLADRYEEAGVLLLLAAIGVRLVTKGLA